MLNLTLACLSVTGQLSSPFLTRTGKMSVFRSSAYRQVAPFIFARDIRLLVDHVRIKDSLQTAIFVQQGDNITYNWVYTSRPPNVDNGYDVTVMDSWFIGCRGDSPYETGGALAVVLGTLTIERSLFANCTTVRQGARGGAVFSKATQNVILSTCLNNCSAKGQGTGVFIDESTTTKIEFFNSRLCCFQSGIVGSQGSLYVRDGQNMQSTMKISNYNSTNNYVDNAGAGITCLLSNGELSISHSHFDDNSGKSIAYFVLFHGGKISNVNFANNKASSNAIVYLSTNGQVLRMESCCFLQNAGATFEAHTESDILSVFKCRADTLECKSMNTPPILVGNGTVETYEIPLYQNEICYTNSLNVPSYTRTYDPEGEYGPPTNDEQGDRPDSGDSVAPGTGKEVVVVGDEMPTGYIVTIILCAIELIVIIVILALLVIFIRRAHWGIGTPNPPRSSQTPNNDSPAEQEPPIVIEESSSSSSSKDSGEEMDTEQVVEPQKESTTESGNGRKRVKRRRRKQASSVISSAHESEPAQERAAPTTPQKAQKPVNERSPLLENKTRRIAIEWSDSSDEL